MKVSSMLLKFAKLNKNNVTGFFLKGEEACRMVLFEYFG